jgi:hypothetical protein
MKKILLLIIFIIGIIALAGCGGSSGGSDDPNLGVWKGVSMEMAGIFDDEPIALDINDAYEKGFTIELKSNGKCALNVDGSKANGTYTLENGVFAVKGGGLDCTGRLENGKLILNNVVLDGVTIVFEKEGGYSAESADTLTGIYWLFTMIDEDDTYDREELESWGIDLDTYYLDLMDDGRCIICMDGDITEGTFKVDGKDIVLTAEGINNIGTIDGDKIILEIEDEDENSTMIFVKGMG